MNDQLLRFKFAQKYICLDFETNSLNLVSTLPWQIGWLTAKGKYVANKFEKKIKWPNYRVDEKIAMLNHFDESSYLREAVDPETALDEFESYIYNPEYITIGQNSLGYDCHIHNNWRKALGRKTDYSWLDRHWDILAVFRAIQSGAKNPPKDDFLAWQYSWINHRDRKIKASLSSQLKHYGINFKEEDKHSALVDVELTFEVFKRQLFELDI